MKTIGLVANVYNEVNALPGWLETHLPFFDDVRVLHAGPQGAYSDDGTMELLEKWRVPYETCAIDDGFGAVRTRALRMSPCDWVMLLDADERFFSTGVVLNCCGEATPQSEVDDILRTYDFRGEARPDWAKISFLGMSLHVHSQETYNAGQLLRDLINCEEYDAIATTRRHWHDLRMRKPSQNWQENPDLQLRCVRNVSSIGYDETTRMHERLYGYTSVARPSENYGPFFDHFHFWFKWMEQAQRSHDIAIYDSIHKGEVPPARG